MSAMEDFNRRYTRRTALKTAGAAALTVTAAGGLPAWARPVLASSSALRAPGSLPFPAMPEGTESMPQIKHIIVLMMENHTFDNFLGMLPHQVHARRTVDGFKVDKHGKPTNANPNSAGAMVRATLAPSPCQGPDITQSWAASHTAYAGGKNTGFVLGSSPEAMLYYDDTDLPFSYSLATQFPIGERYFSSVLAQTYPNRRFLFTGTASGIVATDGTTFSVPAPNGTIFDRLDAQKITWKSYYEAVASWLIVPGALTAARQANNLATMDTFFTDAKAGKLPSFTFLDPNYNTQSQEDPQDVQVGEQFMAKVVNAVMSSPNWHSTALFINYDEGGGYYDHVPPPAALPPDATPPMLGPTDPPGAYDRLGFRVPLYVVSPWARKNYASRVVQDHTSVLAFIERKWNLGAMTMRDANAADMTDYFDFHHAAFLKPPKLAAAPTLKRGLAECSSAGLKPPLPGDGGKGDGDTI
jgi:phospholipase C